MVRINGRGRVSGVTVLASVVDGGRIAGDGDGVRNFLLYSKTTI